MSKDSSNSARDSYQIKEGNARADLFVSFIMAVALSEDPRLGDLRLAFEAGWAGHPGDPHVCNRLKGHKGKHHCGGCGRER
jgi:hypothetical protein